MKQDKEEMDWEVLVLKKAEELIKRKQETCYMRGAVKDIASTSITHRQIKLIAAAFEILKRRIKNGEPA